MHLAPLLLLLLADAPQTASVPPSLHAVTESSVLVEGASSIALQDGRRFTSGSAGQVAVTGLAPDTRYAFTAGEAHGAFTTAPKLGSPTPFTFAVVGDSRDHGKWAEVAHAIALQKPRFLLTTGDNVEDPRSDADWTDYLRAGAELFANVPVFSVMGNHDVGPLYARYNPAPRSDSGSPDFYAFTYGNAAFVALDTNHLDGSQLAWLKGALARLSGGPLFVFAHHPLYSCGRHGSDTHLQEQLQPLLEQAHASAYFAGHDHDLIAWKPVHGVRHFVSGGGGTHLYGLSGCEGTTTFARAGYGFMLVTVAGAQITVRFLDEHGIELSRSTFAAAGERLPVRAAH